MGGKWRKRTMRKLITLLCVSLVAMPLLFIGGSAGAADLSGLVSFTAGTPARAASVNGNFTLLSGALSQTRTGVLAVNPSAFQTVSQGGMYYHNAGYLENQGVAALYFFAPIYLPHGATITKVTSYWHDADATDLSIALDKMSNVDGATNSGYIAAFNSSGTAGDGSTIRTGGDIISPVVDNAGYNYCLSLGMEGSSANKLYSVVIEYTYKLN
jgi:hypothetical protein